MCTREWMEGSGVEVESQVGCEHNLRNRPRLGQAGRREIKDS